MISVLRPLYSFFFFFNDTATTEIYTLSLHDALPISFCSAAAGVLASSFFAGFFGVPFARKAMRAPSGDRKSTRLNSSHGYISYAVFCLKKKKNDESTSSSHLNVLHRATTS